MKVDVRDPSCAKWPKLCCNCNGPHASSAKDCPVWQKKEIQRVRVEKRIYFAEARQLVETKMPTVISGGKTYAAAASKEESPWVYCIWGSFKQHSKETGPHPSPGVTNCSWSFSYFPSNKPLCQSENKMYLKNRRKKISMNCVLKLKHCPDNPAKTFWLQFLASEFYHCLRILRLAWTWLMTTQWLLGVSLNLRSVCLWQNIKKILQTLKYINKHF